MIACNTDIITLLERSKGKKIVCFGAGEYFNWTCEAFEPLGFFKRIDLILDNNPVKQGGLYEFKGEKKPIVSAEECFSRYSGESLVIIFTTKYFYEVFKDLDSDDRLKKTECYLFTFLAAKPLPYKFPVNKGERMRIPKIIHYTWFSGEPIPERFLGFIDSWRKNCPGYEIIEWNQSNYDVNKIRYTREAVKMKKWGFAGDYARLDVVFNMGGIYLDLDVEVVRSFDDLLYDEAFCGMESAGTINLGSGFGAVKAFPIIKEMLDAYDDISFINNDGSLNLVASPKYQTDVMIKHGLITQDKPQVLDGMVVYPTDVLSPKNIQNYMLNTTENTHSIHHYAATWVDRDAMDEINNTVSRFKEFFLLAGEN